VDEDRTRVIPDQEAAHPHHPTGHRWLDLTLALCAMFVSVVSLIVAVRHGVTMDRLVAANSWPFLTYHTSNQDAEGKPRIALIMVNAGVGPARVETFEVWWQGQPVASGDELLTRCCLLKPGGALDLSGVRALGLSLGIVAPAVLRAGDSQDILSMTQTEANADVWQRLDTARLNLRMRACYCSVFDECWVTDLIQTGVKEVAVCPAPKVPFVIPERYYKLPPPAQAPAN
jgi:hypothetical protein